MYQGGDTPLQGACGGFDSRRLHDMNVKELRDLLKEFPDDMEILVARDEEGNGYHRLYETSVNMAVMPKDYGYIDHVYPTPEEIEVREDLFEDEDGAPEEAERVLVIWP